MPVRGTSSCGGAAATPAAPTPCSIASATASATPARASPAPATASGSSPCSTFMGADKPAGYVSRGSTGPSAPNRTASGTGICVGAGARSAVTTLSGTTNPATAFCDPGPCTGLIAGTPGPRPGSFSRTTRTGDASATFSRAVATVPEEARVSATLSTGAALSVTGGPRTFMVNRRAIPHGVTRRTFGRKGVARGGPSRRARGRAPSAITLGPAGVSPTISVIITGSCSGADPASAIGPSTAPASSATEGAPRRPPTA